MYKKQSLEDFISTTKHSDAILYGLNKEQLLKEYGVKFLAYLYQEATLIGDMEKDERELLKDVVDIEKEIKDIGRKLIKKYGEFNFLKHTARLGFKKDKNHPALDMLNDMIIYDMYSRIR